LGAGSQARHGFEDGHIPGARFLPMGVLADPDSDLPMTLPPAGLQPAIEQRHRWRAEQAEQPPDPRGAVQR
jgi:3-mercaptopyruvate sulfurtransferase SseA